MFIENTNTHFVENREKIKKFFEKKIKAKKTVEEFFDVQMVFHLSVKRMVVAFNNIKYFLQEAHQNLLLKLLVPYQPLTENYFGVASGNLDNDIEQIATVINSNNANFKIILRSLLECTANINTFNNLLNSYKNNVEVVDKLKKELNCTWGDIETLISRPFQILMRYQMLLDSIIAVIDETHHSLLIDLLRCLNYIKLHAKSINECCDTILKLNEIEQLLEELLSEVLKQENNQDHVKTKLRIEAALISLIDGKIKVLEGKQDIESLYRVLRTFLKEIEEEYFSTKNLSWKSYFADRAYSVAKTGYHIFVSAPPRYILEVPLQLQKIIKELNILLETPKILQPTQEKIIKRKSLS